MNYYFPVPSAHPLFGGGTAFLDVLEYTFLRNQQLFPVKAEQSHISGAINLSRLAELENNHIV